MSCSDCLFYAEDPARRWYGACLVKRHKAVDTGQFHYAMVRGDSKPCYYYQRKEEENGNAL